MEGISMPQESLDIARLESLLPPSNLIIIS
jgi:hypothetical protein